MRRRANVSRAWTSTSRTTSGLLSFLATGTALLAAVLVGPPTLAQENVSSYSIEELVAAITDDLTSIESLYTEFSLQYAPSLEPIQHRYARTGNQWHWTEFTFDQEKQADRENIFCYDDDLVFGFVVRRPKSGGPEDWSTVQLQDRRAQENVDPEWLLGTKLSNVERSLVDVLQLGEVSTSVAALPDGSNGIRLVVKAVSTTVPGSKVKYDVSVTVDPLHGLLAREILITESAETITFPGWKHHWRITDIIETVDERSRRPRWFPALGVLEQGNDSEPMQLRVSKVQVNGELPATLFRPRIPDGTLLADSTSTGKGRLAIQGGNFAVDKRVSELTEESRRALGPSRRWLIILNVAVFVVIASLVAWRWGIRKFSAS